MKLNGEEGKEGEREQGLQQTSWEEVRFSSSCSQVQCFFWLEKEMWPQEWKEGSWREEAQVTASPVCTHDCPVSFIQSQSGYTNLQGNPVHDCLVRNGLVWVPQPGRMPEGRELEEHPPCTA